MPPEGRVDPREDQVEMQAHNRHEQGEDDERINQGRLDHDLGPVVAPHVGPHRHDAEPVKEQRRLIPRPLPEHPGRDARIAISGASQSNDQKYAQNGR